MFQVRWEWSDVFGNDVHRFGNAADGFGNAIMDWEGLGWVQVWSGTVQVGSGLQVDMSRCN